MVGIAGGARLLITAHRAADMHGRGNFGDARFIRAEQADLAAVCELAHAWIQARSARRPAGIRRDDGYTRLRSIRMTSTMMTMTTIVPMPMYISGSSFSSLFGVHACGRRCTPGSPSAAGDLVEAAYDAGNVAILCGNPCLSVRRRQLPARLVPKHWPAT